MLQIRFSMLLKATSPREARVALPQGGMAIIFSDCQLQHLGDMQGFLVGLYTFGVIPETHPLWNMLDEMAKKNKKVHDGLQAKIDAEA